MKKNKKQILADIAEMRDTYIKYAKYIAPKNIGLCFSPGWKNIIRELFECCEANNYNIQLVQAKEKFGSLRFYYDAAESWPSEVDKKLQEIEAKSATTCDVCGAPGEMRHGGWISCRCDDHVKSRIWDDIPYEEMSEAASEGKIRDAAKALKG
jgi:hypothetical protein